LTADSIVFAHAIDAPEMTIRPPRPALVPHPTLAQTFAALDFEHVVWCLLRGDIELDRHISEIDLLILPEHRRAAERVFRRLGYMRIAGAGRGTHRFWVTYVEQDDRWVKLDTVTELAYGPAFELDSGAAATVLGRRSRSGQMWLPSRSDDFWTLLLHSILDGSPIQQERVHRLRDAAAHATSEGPLPRWLASHAPPRWDADAAIGAARTADLNALSYLGRTMVEAGPKPTAMAARVAMARERVRGVLTERGLSVALLGPDGAGKSTVAARIGERLPMPVRTEYMGLFSRDRVVGRAPSGGLEHASRLVGHVVRQWRGYLRGLRHRTRGRLVVYDRFSYDALLREPRRAWIGGRARRWILAHAVPSPDVVIILDAPAAVLHERKGEHDIATLESQRQAYLRLAERTPVAEVVRTDRSIEDIEREIARLIWRAYVVRHGRVSSASGR
jgi:thymidylate kinase